MALTNNRIHNERQPLCNWQRKGIMDAWADNSMDTCNVFHRFRRVMDVKRTSSDSNVKDLTKESHVPIPYGKAPKRSRKAKKILQQNQSVRPVQRGTWIPGVNDEDITKPTHYIPSETPPSTLRQHQRRVLSANSCTKSLCSSFNTRFMLPGNLSTSDSSSEDFLRTKDDSDVAMETTKYIGVRKTKSMHAGYCRLIQVNQCEETRFSTLPRKIQKVSCPSKEDPSEVVRQKLPVYDLEELDFSLDNDHPMSPGLPGMCEITPRPQTRISRNSRNCTCCSICEMTSPRSCDIKNTQGHSSCACQTCVYKSCDKSGLVQYKHGDVIKTFDWLNRFAKETAL